MKIFVTGAGGQLGHDVLYMLCSRGHTAIGSGRSQSRSNADLGAIPYVPLDITDGAAVERILREIQPDAVIHCAAWTEVDLAEEEEFQEAVRAINVGGTRNLAAACRALSCKMMYISTDYVFSGRGETPWEPDCVEYAPVNVYGQTKLEGERAVVELVERRFLVRIAWAFGKNGKNFVKTMLSLSEKSPAVRVVCDQIGTPTYTRDLARLLVDMIETEKYGCYHATNSGGYISWYEFAREIFHQAGKQTQVIPVTTAEYGLSRAQRPRNSRLGQSKLVQMGFIPLPPWQDALGRYLKEIEEANESNHC